MVYYDEIETIFDLLEKQNKEIERLYKDNYRLDRENQLKFERAVDTSDYVKKEKIREKIEWLENNILENDYASGCDMDIAEYQIDILKELLGE